MLVRTSLLLTAVAALICTAPGANATTITFSEPGIQAGYGCGPGQPANPAGTNIANGSPYASMGVTFAMTNGCDYVSSTSYLGDVNNWWTPALGNQFLTIDTVPTGSANPGTLTATFLQGVFLNSVTFTVADTEHVAPIVNAYDANGILLATQSPVWTGNGLVATFSFPTVAGPSPIVKTLTLTDNLGTGFVMGDLQFQLASPTPEPGTWGAIAGGLAGLLLVRRRRS